MWLSRLVTVSIHVIISNECIFRQLIMKRSLTTESSVPEFSWEVWGKSRKTSVKIADVAGQSQSEYILNTSSIPTLTRSVWEIPVLYIYKIYAKIYIIFITIFGKHSRCVTFPCLFSQKYFTCPVQRSIHTCSRKRAWSVNAVSLIAQGVPR
jgi:hypothetical protein